MAHEKKDGDISVFKNKSDNSKAPAWKGDALYKGEVLEIALWEKGTSGTMLAGVIKARGEKQDKKIDHQAPLPPKANDPLADEIPF